MQVSTVGMDLAKNVFCLHGCDTNGKPVLRKQLARRQLGSLAKLPRCLVAMEACASAHYWAREIEQLGHQARLIGPRFVKPYVKTNKNDASDAEAICEAAGRPTHAFRRRQEYGATGRAGGPSGAATANEKPHRPGQSGARTAGGIRRRGRAGSCAPAPRLTDHPRGSGKRTQRSAARAARRDRRTGCGSSMTGCVSTS